MNGFDDSTELRVGAHVFTTSQIGALIRLEVDRNIENPVLRETIPLYFSPDQMRDFIALCARSLDLKPSDPPHVTKLRGICERIRSRFAAPIDPPPPFMATSEKVVGFVRSPRGEYRNGMGASR